jgi:phosphinothricin acetyltransferase
LGLRVRPAEEHDLPGILEVYNHYVLRTPVTFETHPVEVSERTTWFRGHRAAGPHRLIVAVDAKDRVLGWSSTSTFRPRAAYSTTVEASVYCRSDFTGRGIGSRLYRTLFDSIATEDVERIVAGITLPNAASVALHRRFGFQPVGTFTRVGRKFGKYWDVAWFERPLRTDSPARPSPGSPV